MKAWKSALVWLLVIITACSEKPIEETRSYSETLEEFLLVTGTDMDNNPLLDQASSLFGVNGQDESELTKVLKDSMKVAVHRIYPKYFTQYEMEELITILKSPIGQKFIENNQKVNSEMTTEISRIAFHLMRREGDLFQNAPSNTSN